MTQNKMTNEIYVLPTNEKNGYEFIAWRDDAGTELSLYHHDRVVKRLVERNARLVSVLEKVYAERDAIEYQAYGMSDLFDDIKQALAENKE